MATAISAPPGDPLAKEERAEDHHEDRVGEEDQPLDLRGDVFEAEEVEIARHPIAEEADGRRGEHQPPARQRSGRPPPLAHGMGADDEIERRREGHAEREQRLGVDVVLIGELDRHRLGRKEDRADRGEEIAGPEMALARSGRGLSLCRFGGGVDGSGVVSHRERPRFAEGVRRSREGETGSRVVRAPVGVSAVRRRPRRARRCCQEAKGGGRSSWRGL